MKTSILFSFFTILIIITSCDKVKHPLEATGNTAVGTNFITKSNAGKSNYKKAFVEDYTGHRCGNCPPAAALLETLGARYVDSIVGIAVHAGDFAKVFGEFTADYKTTAGIEWDGPTGFGVSAAGNPNGMVNRKVFTGFALIHKPWDQTVPLALKDPFIVKLDVTTNYDPTARALNTDVKATFKTNYNYNTRLSVVFIEDSIVGPQKDYTKTPDVIDEYEFMHMLRGSMNGTWGADLKTAPIYANDSVKVSYLNYALDTKFNDKKVTVVVFAYDATTKQVLQAEKVKIR